MLTYISMWVANACLQNPHLGDQLFRTHLLDLGLVEEIVIVDCLANRRLELSSSNRATDSAQHLESS